MISHRTTARALLLLLVAGLAARATTSEAATPPPAKKAAAVPPLLFPVVGETTLTHSFGDARGQGRHEGEDIMAPRRSLAVAVEAGTVKFWTTSARAGCMLYLYGDSGTTYVYVHLNNDIGAGNDNAGSCSAGVAYARGLKTGARVAAGEPVGYVGDSGDANGVSPHLHFEVHPGDGGAVDPYPHLTRAKRLLFATKPGTTFTAALRGKLAVASSATLSLDIESVRAYPGGTRTKVERVVDVAVAPNAVVTDPLGAFLATARLDSVQAGQPAVVWTAPAVATLDAQLGEPLSLAAEKVVLLGKS